MQPGEGIKTKRTSAKFHHYVKSNLFPDLKMLFWPFNSLHSGSQLVHEVRMDEKCLFISFFNFILPSQKGYYS